MSAYTIRSVFATLPRTERGRPIVLGADPKGVNFLYCHGNSVIIRELARPEVSDVYTQHSCQVNVAKYSPSGFYIASADKSGRIRLWDTINKEHVLKAEYQPISGPVYDMAWSQDSQRIVCVGEGREKFGHVFLADTGTSNGDITGQSRPVNSCDFRPARPFRIITGSEDNSVAFYEGPPFKFKGTRTEHARYCQSVRYSPDGVFWASGGFDGKIFLYDGKESELITEIHGEGGKNAHGGGIYALSWSGNGKSMLSASGDKTCKLWDVETRKATTTFTIGDAIEDQQLGCLWSGDYMISVSLSGFINYLDPRTPDKPVKVVAGHNKPITKMIRGGEEGNPTLITGGADGRMVEWTVGDGTTKLVTGEGHSSQINGLKRGQGTRVASVGIDDTLRWMDQSKLSYDAGDATKMKSQPRAVDTKGDLTAVATVNSIILVRNGSVVHEEAVNYEPSCIGILNDEELAVGESSGGNSLRIYGLADNGVTEKKKIVLTGALTDLSYSPDSSYLVTADGNRKVTLFSVANDYEKAHSREWGFHTAKVNCVSWSDDSLYVASGGLDCSLIIWSVEKPEKHRILTSAHAQSQITGVSWLDGGKALASSGHDGNVKIWDLDLN